MDYKNLSNEELEKLVAQKDGGAICTLAERYMKAEPRNLTRAYQLLHKGEKMGLKEAYIGLGEMYRQGIRFAKNEKLAREYYKKAGEPYPDGCSRNSEHVEPIPVTTMEISDSNLVEKLNQAESARKNNAYESTKSLCQEVIRQIDNIRSGMARYAGQKDIDIIEIDAYWTLAYTAFNEQDYSAMNTYMNKNGMKGLHPWSVYLKAVSHALENAPKVMLEQDIIDLHMIKDNNNLTEIERGDVYGMIGDLIMDGYGPCIGEKKRSANTYYKEAANCGNEYARDRLKNTFKI